MSNKVKSILGAIVIIGLAGYTIFLLSTSVFRTYQFNQWIEEDQAEITRLEQENERLKNLILYYQTQSFKEVEARKKLGLKAADEKVVVVPENKDQPPAQPQPSGPANYIKWFDYLFR